MTNPKQPAPGSSAPNPVPTPEDPREDEPMRDPPIYPEHDDGAGEIREALAASDPPSAAASALT
jgi:hypothetical protein